MEVISEVAALEVAALEVAISATSAEDTSAISVHGILAIEAFTASLAEGSTSEQARILHAVPGGLGIMGSQIAISDATDNSPATAARLRRRGG